MRLMRVIAGLILAVAMVSVVVSARITAYNGYKATAAIFVDNWAYFDIELDSGDFLGSNETADYKMYISTNIDEAYTARLWFGTADVDDTDTPGEIDPVATGMGRGDRSGEGATPGPGNYVLSVYATCFCIDVFVEVSMHLVDGNDNMVPFKIRPKMTSVDLEVPVGEVLVWGFHNTTAVDDNVYVKMSLDNQLNSVDVVYEAGAYPTALSDRYPTGSSTDGDYVTAPLAVGAGITYFGSQGVASIAGGSVGHRVLLGINDLPTPLDVGPPDCAGDFALRLDNADYSAIADCVTFDGSIVIDTSASLDFSLPNLESITGTLWIASPLSSVSLPSLETADRLTIGDFNFDCAVETLSLPSLATIGTQFKVACQGLRVFDLPLATDLGFCDLFWAGEESAEIDIPCGGVMVSSFIPIDLTFPLLETATHAGARFAAFGRISFPNLVSVSSSEWAGVDLYFYRSELMGIDMEVGDLEIDFPVLTSIDGSLIATTQVEGGEGASATLFMPELTEVTGIYPGFNVVARGDVIPVAIVAPKLESISSGLAVEGEASVYFDALETVAADVEIDHGTVCMPALAAVGGDFTVTVAADTCVLPDVSGFEDHVVGTLSGAAPVCTAEECTAPSNLDDSSEAGAASLVAAGGVGLVALVCAAVVAVATAAVVG